VAARANKFLLSGLGTGYLPIAPGSWASLAVALLYLLAWRVWRGWPVHVAMVCLAIAAGAVCVALGRLAETAFGRKDPRQCTADEWAGQAVALAGLPVGLAWPQALLTAGVSFVAFRVLDIVKPPPARRLERLALGWGVLADDLAAGVYANLISQLILRLVLDLP
jgi:phosphatidylglycerophosphatase A